MAESFDKREQSPVISDDLIKEALKAGLSSIQPSDDLVKKTIEKCQSEIGRVNERNKKLNFVRNPWFYRLGAPLAVGALVLVLFFSENQPYKNKSTQETAPGALRSAITQEDEATARSSVEAPAEFSAAVLPSEEAGADSGSGGMMAKSFYGEILNDSQQGMQALNSLTNRTKNQTEENADAYMAAFKGIVDQHNSLNGTELTMDRHGVIRVQTLVETGVDIELLLNSRSYKEILSGEGYWALPLSNSQGVIEMILNVNELDPDNAQMVVSSNDLIVEFNGEKYLVSNLPSGDVTGKGHEILFDAESLNSLVRAEGYESVSEMVIVDINYGMDFLVFVQADGRELAIPCLTNASFYGLENEKVYVRHEIFNIMSENMQR